MKRCLLLVALGVPLRANDAVVYEYPDGRTVEPTEENRVQMLAETVTVQPTGRLEVRVQAKFHLKNLSQNRVDLTVGFPFRPRWGRWNDVFYEEGLKSTAESLTRRLRLISKVNGKSVKTHFKLSREGEPTLWAVWKVSWEPGETKTLETEYTTSWSRWHDVMGFFEYSLEYITQTGAGWAGKIGNALVRFRLPPQLPRQGVDWKGAVLWVWTTGGQVSGDTLITWSFKDWEPDKNLKFRVFGTSDAPWLTQSLAESLWAEGLPQTKGEIAKLFESVPQPPPLIVQLVINLAFARQGRVFSDPQWKILEDLPGYRAAGKLSYKDLSPEEKRVVKAALELKDSLLSLYKRNSENPFFTELYLLPALLSVYGPEGVAKLRDGTGWRETLKEVVERALKKEPPPCEYLGLWWAENAQWLETHRKALREILKHVGSRG